jgi:hypothetical protein
MANLIELAIRNNFCRCVDSFIRICTMTADYHSFLICQHPTHADVYLTGIPLGQIVDGKFVPRQIVVDGEKRDFDIKSVPNTPFRSIDDLCTNVEVITNAMYTRT